MADTMTKLEKTDSKNLIYRTNLIYFIVVVGFVIIRICSHYGVFSFLGTYGSYILSIVTQVGLICLLPFLLLKCLNKASVKETVRFFSFKKISYKAVLVSIALGLVVFFLNVYVSSFFNSIIQLFGYKPAEPSSQPATWWVLVLNLLCTAVLPAICEEVLHRGMLLKGNSSLGMKKSIIISGLLFGLLHMNIEQFFYATIIGLFLGVLCWCSSSIYPCIIIHFMNNATSVFLSFAKAKGWAVGNLFSNISKLLMNNPLFGFILFFLCLCLLVVLVVELTKFLIKDSFNYNFVAKQKELASMYIRESYFNDVESLKKEENVQEPSEFDKKVIYINAKDFMNFVDKNIKEIIKTADGMEKAEKVPKIEDRTKIFLYGSIVLSAIITIMTFIWGLL